MPGGLRRPGFYFTALLAGFMVGGFVSELLVRFLPDSAAKQLFTFTVSPSIGPVSLDLLVITFTAGPVGLHVSVLSLLGAAIAHVVARSLF